MEKVYLQLVNYPYKRNKIHYDPVLRQISLESNHKSNFLWTDHQYFVIDKEIIKQINILSH